MHKKIGKYVKKVLEFRKYVSLYLFQVEVEGMYGSDNQ